MPIKPLILLLAACLLLGAAPARAQEEKPADTPPPKPKKEKKHRERKFEALRDFHLGLDYLPVAPVVPAGKARFNDYTPMHPAGFRANEYGFLAGTYGLGDGWEATAGATEAERLGPGGSAYFFGLGVQKQFMKDTDHHPALAVGAYGMTGPHEHHSGAFYLAATKRLLGGRKPGFGVFLHGGLRYERFGSNDYGEGDGVRPYGGLTVGVTRRLYFSGEISPPQPWEEAEVYAIRGTYLVYKSYGVSGGIRSNGYRTYPFVEVAF